MSDEKPCVFCDRKNFEEQLIGETEQFYFIASLGQITDGGYVLVIPKRHVPCIGAMEKQEIIEIEQTIWKTNNVIRAEYGVRPIIFEHGIVGQTITHAHLHILPAQIRIEHKVRKDFPEARVNVIYSLEILRLLYTTKKEKYLLWNVPWYLGMDKKILYECAWDPPAPPQYLRLIVAELLGRPERGNWRKMDPELDKRFWSETVLRLKKYF